jgi:dipeptidyl-peptidase-4
MRKLLIFFCITLAASGQRKPVTLDSLNELRARIRDVPGDPVWAPDGKRFAFLQGRKLMLYEVAQKQSREITSLEPMDSAAVKEQRPEKFDWENRRVSEAPLQWDSAGKELLYLSGGDLFLIDSAGGNWRQMTKTAAAERDPKFSPDARRIAFRRDWDLYTLDIASGKETRLTSNGSETLRNGALDWVYPEELDLGTAYWWSPDSKSIAYLQFDISREPLYPHEDLLRERPVYEPQRYPQAGDNNPQVRLGVIAAGGGATKWMETGDTVNSYLITRAGWLPNSKKIYVARTNRVQNQLEFMLFDAGSGKSSVLFEESDRFWINIEGDPIFLHDGRRFLWTSQRDGFRHIYLYSLDGLHSFDGRTREQLTSGPWEVTGIAGVDETSGRVYYQSSESSPLERQLYSVRWDGTDKRRVTMGAGTHRISMAPGCGYFLDTFSSLTSPPQGTLRSQDGGEISVYRPQNRVAVDEFEIQPTEIVEFDGPGGAHFYARLIKPVGFDPARKYPAIVDVYGGPGVQAVRNAWPGVNMDQVFANKGYVVWEMDNRGSAGRGHAFESPVFRNLGTTELADQRAGVEHLISMGFVDSHRIGVTGWSFGGFMTLNLLLNAPDLVQAGFAGAPVTNWLNYDTIYTERYMGLPKDNADGYSRTSLPPHAANLKGKLTIAHNFEDDNVLFQNTLQIISALELAGKEFELHIYPQKTHGVSGPAARRMDATMLDFFDRSLSTNAAR